jgi:hypothetical protein
MFCSNHIQNEIVQNQLNVELKKHKKLNVLFYAE